MSSQIPIPVLLIILASLLFFALLLLIIFLLLRLRGTFLPSARGDFAAAAGRIDEISHQLQDLQRIFLIPYVRGGVGEVMLSQLLENWLPKENFQLQYSFKSGDRADAVIKLGKYLVAVDSKFPLERFLDTGLETNGDRRMPGELKRLFMMHARDIAEKYIRTHEGTMNFALMYIPSERMFYNLFIHREGGLMEECMALNVVPVSPGSLFLYLQTVAYGLRGLQLPRKIETLMGLLQRLKGDIAGLSRTFAVSETHLKNLRKSMEENRIRLDRLEHFSERLDHPDIKQRTADEDGR